MWDWWNSAGENQLNIIVYISWHCCSVARFLSTLQDKVSWRPNFDRTWCPDDAKIVGHQTYIEENPWLWTNKTGKVEVHITDNQSLNSCHKVAFDYKFTFSSAFESTKKKHYAFTIHGHLLQPKHGASAVWMHWSMCLSFALNGGLKFVGE